MPTVCQWLAEQFRQLRSWTNRTCSRPPDDSLWRDAIHKIWESLHWRALRHFASVKQLTTQRNGRRPRGWSPRYCTPHAATQGAAAARYVLDWLLLTTLSAAHTKQCSMAGLAKSWKGRRRKWLLSTLNTNMPQKATNTSVTMAETWHSHPK